MVTEITDGYGNYVKPTFVSIAQGSYTQNANPTYPDQSYLGPLYVVSGATFSDPSGYAATYSQTYTYYNALVNAQGRGFEGFGLIGTYDSRNALTDFVYYEQSFPYTGVSERKCWHSFQLELVSRDHRPGGGRYRTDCRNVCIQC